jgi:hypothetical protein
VLPYPIDLALGDRGRVDEQLVDTMQSPRPSPLRLVGRKLALPVAVTMVIGLAIGGYIVLSSDHTEAVATPSPIEASPPPVVARPAPAAVAPAAGASPSATPLRLPALVEVRIESTPPGATVLLVDRGKTQLVGTTPINASVDPAREYDLVFSHTDDPTQPVHVEHLDARTTRRVAVTLGGHVAPAAPAPPVVVAAPLPAARKADRLAQVEPATGQGTLMISSKPPCEIVIDGTATGLMTPQRSIALPAGRHKVTLVNRENEINRTIAIRITANATEKVIEDLMK